MIVHSGTSLAANQTEQEEKIMEQVIDTTKISQQYATINGIRYHYAEAGKGPLVIMLHGFPELWFSWRNQLQALANAGYHAVAPDLRGFGESEVTPFVKDYSLVNHAKDIKALIDHLGEKEAVLAANQKAFFTIPHFDGYSAVLIQLPLVTSKALKDALTDGWLCCATPSLSKAFLAR